MSYSRIHSLPWSLSTSVDINRVMRPQLWCALALLTTGCASRSGAIPQPFPRVRPHVSAPPAASVINPPTAASTTIASTALDYQGVPFIDGGETPTGFDCSGLTYYVFRKHGIQLPRTARAQYRVGVPVGTDQIAPGDLLFFQTVAPGASHVALAIGPDEFVHAPSERGHVRVERLSSRYWARRFLGARRVLPSPDESRHPTLPRLP